MEAGKKGGGSAWHIVHGLEVFTFFLDFNYKMLVMSFLHIILPRQHTI